MLHEKGGYFMGFLGAMIVVVLCILFPPLIIILIIVGVVKWFFQ